MISVELHVIFYRELINQSIKAIHNTLAIFTEIGDREGVAAVCVNQGNVEQAVGNLIKAKEYFEKALAISKNIGNRILEAEIYLTFGRFLSKQSDYDRTEEYVKKALALSEKTGVLTTQLYSLITLAKLKKNREKIKKQSVI